MMKFITCVREGLIYELDKRDLTLEELAFISSELIKRLHGAGIVGINEELQQKYPVIGPGGQLIARRHTFRNYAQVAKDKNGNEVSIILKLVNDSDELKMEIDELQPILDVIAELRLIEALLSECYSMVQHQVIAEKTNLTITSEVYSDFKSGIKNNRLT